MSSTLQPVIQIFKADAALAKGKVVKIGASSDENVQVSSAATDKHIGIAQNAPTAANDLCEVAVDGGAKGLLGGTVVAGDLLTADSDGKLVATTTANDKLIAKAHEGGVANDLIAVKIIDGNY